jgi:hypothetical protein
MQVALITFESLATNLAPGGIEDVIDILVHDRQTGRNRRVSVGSHGTPADADGRNPAISADGTVVAFESGATNLIPRDTNEQKDVFVRTLVP